MNSISDLQRAEKLPRHLCFLNTVPVGKFYNVANLFMADSPDANHLSCIYKTCDFMINFTKFERIAVVKFISEHVVYVIQCFLVLDF